jgi:hypothetical protein
MFIISPLYLFLIAYLQYRYSDFEVFIYGTTILILMYLTIFEDFMFKKSIVKEIQNMEAKEVNSISPDISSGQ